MKVTVGMGSIDAYPELAEAGADEIFCGYVPFDMISEFSPVNRREVRAVNVQIGSESELRILADMKREIGVPVAITFNALCYSPEALRKTVDLIKRCSDYGFRRFIIADPAVLTALRQCSIDVDIHISGEIGEINRYVISECAELHAKRIIFHRKMTFEDMSKCVRARPELEYEAFALNEMCHFHGGFCNTLHCDELPHMCRVPYRLDGNELPLNGGEETILGASGCGFCALWKLREAGVTILKLVGRGNYPEMILRDLKALKTAISILDNCSTEKEYIERMKKELFSDGCSHHCYY